MLGGDRHTQGEGRVMTEAEAGEMKPQAKEGQNCQEAKGSREAAGKDSLRTLCVPGELWSCEPLILDL